MPDNLPDHFDLTPPPKRPDFGWYGLAAFTILCVTLVAITWLVTTALGGC